MKPISTRQTLLSYLDDYLTRRDTVFVQRQGLRLVSWSYQQLVLTSRKTARELETRGVARGERVILCGANSAEWVAAFWGCLLRGVVVVPIDRQSSAEFVSSVQQQTAAKLAIVDRDATALKHLPIPFIELERLVELTTLHSSEPYVMEGVTRETLAEIVFTSGTTSTPKGVMLTHANILANLTPLEREIGKYQRWRRLVHPLRFLVLVPLSHVFGQFMSVFVPQLLGGEVHFEHTLNPADIVRRTRKSRISVIVLVPRMLRSLRERIERDVDLAAQLKTSIQRASNLSFLRRWWTFRQIHRQFGWKLWAFLSGGATLDHQTEEFWRRLGFAVLQGYGMTETASLVTVTHPFKLRQGSIGKALPGYEVKLDESGQIAVRGPAVSAGYWSKVNGNNRSADGWLNTGDVGVIDNEGHVYFKGREKDVIVTASGTNVYPEDLEEALNRQHEVCASCVVGWPSEHGEEPLAAIILRHADVDVSQVIENANLNLAEHQRIRRWYTWPEPDFPRTATEKVLKREVIARIKENTASNDPESCQACRQSSFIVATAARISGEMISAAADPNLKLATDLKLDSMGRIELLSALEERYEIDIDEAAFTAATTVGDVERIVRGEAEQQATPYPFVNWPRRFPITWLRALLFYSLIYPITRVMSRMSIAGREQLSELKGPALFVANHVTLGDQAMVLVGLPVRLRHQLAIAMEGERLRNWLHPASETPVLMRLRGLAQYFLVRTFFNVFPLPRKSGFRRSFAYVGECIDRGESVLVFPEGVRAPRGQMHMSPFKTGIGVLVKELNVPVVPVKLTGLYELKKRRQYFASPGTVSVVFGEPLELDPETDAKEIAEELQRRLEEL
ncbi:MAG TPA: AMP-binding protein [Pyrinomonadaceae bacterium]|nr:AMP-binding protein [Pyrinomonadaceae bacterium]